MIDEDDAGPTSPPTQLGLRLRVLVVDDDDNLRFVLREVLAAGFDVQDARNVAEAEQLVRAREFDVVVSDHVMPGESGLSFLSRLNSTVDPFPVGLLITAHDDLPAIRALMSQPGATKVLLKPHDPEKLARGSRQRAPSPCSDERTERHANKLRRHLRSSAVDQQKETLLPEVPPLLGDTVITESHGPVAKKYACVSPLRPYAWSR